jgi:hypothetical protein
MGRVPFGLLQFMGFPQKTLSLTSVGKLSRGVTLGPLALIEHRAPEKCALAMKRVITLVDTTSATPTISARIVLVQLFESCDTCFLASGCSRNQVTRPCFRPFSTWPVRIKIEERENEEVTVKTTLMSALYVGVAHQKYVTMKIIFGTGKTGLFQM